MCRKDGREAARGGLYTRVLASALHMDFILSGFGAQHISLNS